MNQSERVRAFVARIVVNEPGSRELQPIYEEVARAGLIDQVHAELTRQSDSLMAEADALDAETSMIHGPRPPGSRCKDQEPYDGFF